MRGSVQTVKTFASIRDILAIGHSESASEHGGQRRKPWLPVLASNGNMNLFNPKGKTNMKTPILVSAVVAGALSAPIVSAQERPAPAKPAMSMGMDRQMSQLKENMKEMQQQMN
jgi:hypothetical protein